MSLSPAHLYPNSPDESSKALTSQEDHLELDHCKEVYSTFSELVNHLEEIAEKKRTLNKKMSLESMLNKIVNKIENLLGKQSLLEQCVFNTNKKIDFLVQQMTLKTKKRQPQEGSQPPTTTKQPTFADMQK
ncbi:hypothetical protein O181_008972 [Austropuccinia psidii MF-1]|uniref:Uncharacterized protein n=1 Tax=Austropuccinia psidii MF-1 TaxID=1389203 RepID=A0A9Q3GJW0_9BASI|nr:hypothetical protein [Austropuccinia psidii MF-1]